MAYSPKTPYVHDGHQLHPKLSYALPEGMGERMVDLGLFVEVEGEPDLDLSSMPWDSGTVRGSVVTPDSLTHEQTAGVRS